MAHRPNLSHCWFLQIKFIETQRHCLFMCCPRLFLQHMLQQQSWALATDIIWPTRLNIYWLALYRQICLNHDLTHINCHGTMLDTVVDFK